MLHKDICKPIREAFEFLDLVRFISEILRYMFSNELNPTMLFTMQMGSCQQHQSMLVKVLVVKQLYRTLPTPEVVILDECVILWTIL